MAVASGSLGLPFSPVRMHVTSCYPTPVPALCDRQMLHSFTGQQPERIVLQALTPMPDYTQKPDAQRELTKADGIVARYLGDNTCALHR